MKRQEAQYEVLTICEQVRPEDAVAVILQAMISATGGAPKDRWLNALEAISLMMNADSEAIRSLGQQVPPGMACAAVAVSNAMDYIKSFP